MLTASPDGFADDLGGFLGPYEWFGMRVPVLNVVANMRNQGLHRDERPAPDRLAGQDSEPRFDHVQPRGTRGSEMEADVGMGLKPVSNFWGRMGGGVVQDQVHGQIGRHAVLNQIQN